MLLVTGLRVGNGSAGCWWWECSVLLVTGLRVGNASAGCWWWE